MNGIQFIWSEFRSPFFASADCDYKIKMNEVTDHQTITAVSVKLDEEKFICGLRLYNENDDLIYDQTYCTWKPDAGEWKY